MVATLREVSQPWKVAEYFDLGMFNLVTFQTKFDNCLWHGFAFLSHSVSATTSI